MEVLIRIIRRDKKINNNLQTFSDKRIRVFLTGNYEFLCRMYGITGATGTSTSTASGQMYIYLLVPGRHCCIWCDITSQKLKLDPSSVHVTPRSLHTLSVNHQAFVAAGGDVTKVKEFKNVLYKPFFEICIEQVQQHLCKLKVHKNNMYTYVLGVNARSPH